MAIFTKLNKEDITEDTKELWKVNSLIPINWWTDNSVYYFNTDKENEYIYKLYEWKIKRSIDKVLAIHKRIDNILTHKPLKTITNKKTDKIAIIFNYINNNDNYNITEIIDYIELFHKYLNKEKEKKVTSKKHYLNWIDEEIKYFVNNIKKEWYINSYPNMNLSHLYSVYNESLNKVLKNKEELSIGLIHNDLNKWNILNTDNWVEFIDFDWVNTNIILKDYIIFIIRFNIYDKLDRYFINIDNTHYIIGNEKISKNLISELYKIYSIYLIFNMIYYIWYDNKNVKDEMYKDKNQSWQNIYKNLQKNKII